MSDITIQIQHYKLLKNYNESFKNARILLVTGKNEIGKSSLIRALIENITATSQTDDPVTHGELTGSKSFTIPDKNGNNITIVHEYSNSNKKGSFYCIDHEGHKIKEVGKIREIIGIFEEISIDTFYSLQQTAAGRRKIIENYLYPLLQPDERAEIVKINTETEKGGTLYDSRTTVNQEIAFYSNMISDIRTTEEDKILAAEYDNIAAEINKLEQDVLNQRERAIIAQNTLQKTSELNDSLSKYPALYLELKTETDSYVKSKEQEIEEYAMKISKAKQDIEASQLNYKTKLTKLQNEELATSEALKKHKSAVASIEPIINYDEKLSELRQFKDQSLQAKSKIEKYDDIREKHKSAQEKALALENEIAMLRKKKKQILENSKLPSGLSIEEDSFTWNGFKFSDTQISKSSALLVIAEILCNIVESKIVYLGEKALFDEERFKKLVAIAERYGKIPILEQVIDYQNEIKVIVNMEDI